MDVASWVLGIAGVIYWAMGTHQSYKYWKKTVRCLEEIDPQFAKTLGKSPSKFGSDDLYKRDFGGQALEIYLEARKTANRKTAKFMSIGLILGIAATVMAIAAHGG